MPDRISFQTVDGATIIGTWVEVPQPVAAALLLHMMPATRTSWTALQAALAEQQIASLAIDLRGHGESVQGPDGVALDYHKFVDEDHQASSFDVEGALDWMKAKGNAYGRIVLVGASIGANLAISTLVEQPQLPAAVLLSPGEEYRGLNGLEAAQGLNEEQSILIIASADDAKSFADSRRLIDETSAERKQLIELKDAGHGTNMLTHDPSLLKQIATWSLSVLR